jgi:hypothetical protein
MSGSFGGERGGGLRGCERYRGSFDKLRTGSSRSKDALRMTARTGKGGEQEQATAKCGGPSTAQRTMKPSAAPIGMTTWGLRQNDGAWAASHPSR